MSDNQGIIISDEHVITPIVNVSTPSSITINLLKCRAPGLNIDGLKLPNNIYSVINVADIGSVVVMTLYVRDYKTFDTFTITDVTGCTRIIIGASVGAGNMVKKIEWNNFKLSAECLFDPMSNGAIVINWLYNRFIIVSNTPFFRRNR